MLVGGAGEEREDVRGHAPHLAEVVAVGRVRLQQIRWKDEKVMSHRSARL